MIDQDLHKVCPVCGGEYRFDVERCADCGVPLVHPQEIALRDARELPRSPVLVPLRTAPIDWVQALAGDLERQGIRYRIDRRRAREEGLLTLHVRRQDWQAAKEMDEARARIEEPSRPENVIEPRALRQEVPSYKVCPQCGGEYRLDIERCADCGTVLVLPAEGMTGEEEEEADERPQPGSGLVEAPPFDGPLHELPPSDDLVCVSCRYVNTLHQLSQALDEAGIFHRLEPAPYGSREVGCLLVLPADADAAADIDDGFTGPPLDGDDPPAELTVCPACGATHSLNAKECGVCGLGFGSEGLLASTCYRCGAAVWLTASRCPNCGVAQAFGGS